MIRLLILSFAFLIPTTIHNETFIIEKKEQLIVFVQKSNSEVHQVFKEEMLPQIKELAESEGLEYVLQEIDGNAPKEVTYTPFISFRDSRGVSVFSGRWNQITKIKNFIRSTRVLHQGNESNYKKDILVWQWGRMNLIAPLKITDLQGKLPKNYDAEDFKKKAKAAIEKGSARFNIKKQIDVNLKTRSFYWAMYPYRDKKGKYHITGEIYSQYNCVDPIYKHFENPVIDKDYAKAFQKMAAILEEQLVYQMDNPKNGDGFKIVDTKVKSIPWNKFGKIEGENGEEESQDWSLYKGKKNWKVKGAFADNIPMVYFKFMQPIDGYTGEVRDLKGELLLENEDNLKGAKGKFTIPITAITMGDSGLDDAIHTFILDGEKHPEASFTFKEIKQLSGSLEGKDKSEVEISGEMELKGKTASVQTKGIIKPYIRDGKSYLHVNVKFGINKSDFEVKKGPDGPDEIKEQMEFYMNFLME